MVNSPAVASILVVDDERSMREFLAIWLKRAGHEVTCADSGMAVRRLLESGAAFDLVLTDLRMPGDISGIGVLEMVKDTSPETQVIVVTAYATTDTAIEAMKKGAYDYLTKPFKVDEVAVVVERALERQSLVRTNIELRRQVEKRYRLSSLLGKSAAMQRVFDLVRKMASTRTNVLVTGESGTGKELVARALHFEGPRQSRPFIAVNCGAIPGSLLESELFGHKRGAFTGADKDKEGLFAAAHGGTLFLDEIGELPQELQVKLLRVLQERKIKPVGGTAEMEVDVRVIAATNRDLEGDVHAGAFRQDLYYRLNVVEIRLPPLRQRREDIPLLAEHFLRRLANEMQKPITGFSPEALSVLVDYDYPGNVRELENIIERAVTLETTSKITRESLPDLSPHGGARLPPGHLELPPEGTDLDRILADVERDLLVKALERAGGVQKVAARLLGISFRSFRYRLEKHGIEAGTREASGPGE